MSLDYTLRDRFDRVQSDLTDSVHEVLDPIHPKSKDGEIVREQLLGRIFLHRHAHTRMKEIVGIEYGHTKQVRKRRKETHANRIQTGVGV